MSKDPARFISSLVRGMSCCRLYPGNHPSISSHAAEVSSLLRDYHLDNVVTISADGDRTLSVNGDIVPLETTETKRFFQMMKKKEIFRIMIRKEIRAEELVWLLADLASFRCAFRSYDNVAVRLNKYQRGGETEGDTRSREEIDRVRKLYHDINVYKNIDMRVVDSIVGGLIASARTGKAALKELVTSGDESDRLLTHSYNVALISILQAEHLGLGSSLLYDIGFAALTHDVGITFLPQNVRNNVDSLTTEGWTLMKKHPLLGAAFLSSLIRVPEIAAVVAFEHHLKYDGTGYPRTMRYGRRQHVTTQIVCIADWFCALHDDLPHRKPLTVPVIAKLLTETAGTESSPFLVRNFLEAIRTE